MHTHPIAYLASLASLEENWDSYGGKPINGRAIARAVEFLDTFEFYEAVVRNINIIPTSEGGIGLEWHYGGKDVELEISPDGDYISVYRSFYPDDSDDHPITPETECNELYDTVIFLVYGVEPPKRLYRKIPLMPFRE